MDEIIFIVEESPEGGYTARALGASIFTEADDLRELHDQVRGAVRCHFGGGERPKIVRLVTACTSASMKKISQGTAMDIPFPSQLSLADQCSAVAHLDALQVKAGALKRLQAETQAELDALLPSILDRAFRGEV